MARALEAVDNFCQLFINIFALGDIDKNIILL